MMMIRVTTMMIRITCHCECRYYWVRTCHTVVSNNTTTTTLPTPCNHVHPVVGPFLSHTHIMTSLLRMYYSVTPMHYSLVYVAYAAYLCPDPLNYLTKLILSSKVSLPFPRYPIG